MTITPKPLIRLDAHDEPDQEPDPAIADWSGKSDPVEEEWKQHLEAQAERVRRECPPEEYGNGDGAVRLRENILSTRERRLAIARLLLERGPMLARQIREALGLSQQQVNNVIIRCSWFYREASGNSAHPHPVELTDAGREAARG